MSAHHPECPSSHGDAFECTCASFMPVEAVNKADRADDLRQLLSEPVPPHLERLIQRAAARKLSEHSSPRQVEREGSRDAPQPPSRDNAGGGG